MKQLDILFINPNSTKDIYQSLSKGFTAIEPPTWLLLLAEGCRTKGHNVDLIDYCAEHLSHEETSQRIKDLNPRLVCFVVYGQNPSAGIANMSGAIPLAKNIKQVCNTPIIFVGSYGSALPEHLLSYDCVDFVAINEGLYCLLDLLQTNFEDDLDRVRALGYKKDDKITINSGKNSLVPQDRMDIDFPGYAWDLLPYKEKPFDLYKAHLWHVNFNPNQASPFCAIYTSLGCKFNCDFCIVNLINRISNEKNICAQQFSGMRFWSTRKIMGWFDELGELGVHNIRLSDEMFFLNSRHFDPILDRLKEKDYVKYLHMWAYTRVDTIQENFLEKCTQSGIKWLAPGIEAASQKARQSSSKGSFSNEDIVNKIRMAQQYGINIIGDYIFGLPEDNTESMNDTLNLMLELNTETINCYPCMALPGSKFYLQNKEEDLPKDFSEYSFLSYDCCPMDTKYCTKEEVLEFRDNAWQTYFHHKPYLNMIQEKFGQNAVDTIKKMSSVKLKRKILGD